MVTTAYWCEGAKSKPWQRREKLRFINSDADLIGLFSEWLRRRGVEPEACRNSVNMHETADLLAATEFWASVVGCESAQFAKPTIKRHNPRTAR